MSISPTFLYWSQQKYKKQIQRTSCHSLIFVENWLLPSKHYEELLGTMTLAEHSIGQSVLCMIKWQAFKHASFKYSTLSLTVIQCQGCVYLWAVKQSASHCLLQIVSMDGVLTWIPHAFVCADFSHWLTFYPLLRTCKNKSLPTLHLTTVTLVNFYYLCCYITTFYH